MKTQTFAMMAVLVLSACGGEFNPVADVKKAVNDTVDQASPWFSQYDPLECATIWRNKNAPTGDCACEEHPSCITEAASYNWPAGGCGAHPECRQLIPETFPVSFYDNFPDPEGL